MMVSQRVDRRFLSGGHSSECDSALLPHERYRRAGGPKREKQAPIAVEALKQIHRKEVESLRMRHRDQPYRSGPLVIDIERPKIREGWGKARRPTADVCSPPRQQVKPHAFSAADTGSPAIFRPEQSDGDTPERHPPRRHESH